MNHDLPRKGIPSDSARSKNALANARTALPGSRVLPGSYYDVPIAIGYPKGSPRAMVEYANAFVADMKASGFAQKAIERMGRNAEGVVLAQ